MRRGRRRGHGARQCWGRDGTRTMTAALWSYCSGWPASGKSGRRSRTSGPDGGRDGRATVEHGQAGRQAGWTASVRTAGMNGDGQLIRGDERHMFMCGKRVRSEYCATRGRPSTLVQNCEKCCLPQIYSLVNR
jgi:hypothetical protein